MNPAIFLILSFTLINGAIAKDVLYCAGTVRYSDGKPAVGVNVAYYPGYHDGAGNYAEVKTDKDGHYAIIGPEDRAVRIGIIDHINFIMARDVKNNVATIQKVDMEITNIDLMLQPAITISGFVKDTEGAPILGAMVKLYFINLDLPVELIENKSIKVDELGQFSISALPKGCEYAIDSIAAKGYGSGGGILLAKDTQTNHCEFPTIVLKRADKKIAGRVQDKNGKPLTGVKVYFDGKGQPMDFDYSNGDFNGPADDVPYVREKTDSEGRFQFDAVCDGPLQVVANASALVHNLPDSLTKTNWPKNWPDSVKVQAEKLEKEQAAQAQQAVQAGDTNIVIQLQFSYSN